MKPAVLYVAMQEWAGYEITALGTTAEGAQAAVEALVAKSVADGDTFDPRPYDAEESIWEWMGGNVREFVLDGPAVWV